MARAGTCLRSRLLLPVLVLLAALAGGPGRAATREAPRPEGGHDAAARDRAGGPTSRPAELTVRNAHALAYDSARGEALLFGGADEASVRGETFLWNGRRWRAAPGAGPPPRTFPAMAYDGARRQVVLFGGNRVLFGPPGVWDTFLGDTWVWDGRSWRRVDVPGPGARAEAAMAYDAGRRRVVLFGGHTRNEAGRVRLGDTWEWDGREWRLAGREGPSPRNGAALAYDARRPPLLWISSRIAAAAEMPRPLPP
jgi:hypothetical protein